MAGCLADPALATVTAFGTVSLIGLILIYGVTGMLGARSSGIRRDPRLRLRDHGKFGGEQQATERRPT